MLSRELSKSTAGQPASAVLQATRVALFCTIASGASACNASAQHDRAADVRPSSAQTAALESGAQTSPGGMGSPDASRLAAYAALSDGQVWFVIDTLEAGEVDRARAALPRLVRDEVRYFAEDMIAEHEPMRDRLLRLAADENIDPALSDEAARLRRKNEAGMLELLQAGPVVDALYVGAQAAAHGEALALLEALIAVADSGMLRDELGELRTSMEAELQQARELARGPD